MEKYETTDIVLAAVLKMCGAELIDIIVTNKKGNFIFANINDEFLQDYFLGKTRVEPIAFNNALKQLVTAVRGKMNG